MKDLKEKKKEAMVRLWAICGSFMFLYQSILIFFTIIIKSYPDGQVIINTNKYGEMIYEIIMSGCILIISITCLGYSVISTISKYIKEKKIRREEENEEKL